MKTHMTIVFKKGMGPRKEEYKTILSNVIDSLYNDPGQIIPEISEKSLDNVQVQVQVQVYDSVNVSQMPQLDNKSVNGLNITLKLNGLNTTLKLNGWMNDTSIIFAPECVMHQLKTKFVTKLMSSGLISQKDLDQRNLTPHIQILEYPGITADEKNKIYNTMNERSININTDTLMYEKNFLAIKTGHSGSRDTHMTLIFKRGWIRQKDAFMKVFEEVFNEVKHESPTENTAVKKKQEKEQEKEKDLIPEFKLYKDVFMLQSDYNSVMERLVKFNADLKTDYSISELFEFAQSAHNTKFKEIEQIKIAELIQIEINKRAECDKEIERLTQSLN
jgi:hypothetical protein